MSSTTVGSGRPMIAVALAAATTDAALQAMQDCVGLADIAEVRLDLMDEFDVARLLRERCLPIVVTVRPPREGGRYSGDEATRQDILAEAVTRGAEYVDVEEDSCQGLIDLLGAAGTGDGPAGHVLTAEHPDSAPFASGAARIARGTRLIVSHHDFETMPIDLKARHARLASAVPGAIPKLAGMACRAVDMAPMMTLLRDAGTATIAIAMGEAGVSSRVLALRYPATLLTFASMPATMGRPTAPGQIQLGDMHEVFHCRAIGPATVPFGLLCRTIDVALLAGYNTALREAGADAVCVPLPVDHAGDVIDVLETFRTLGMGGYATGPDVSFAELTDIPGVRGSRTGTGMADTIITGSQGWEAIGCRGRPRDQVAAWLGATCSTS